MGIKWTWVLWLTMIIFVSPSWAKGPRISFDTETYDYGTVRYGMSVSKRFLVKNTGDQLLIIKKVEADCGCTNTVVGSQELPPGETSEIVAEFDTTGLSPGRKKKHVYVESNDPDRPSVTLTLLADVIRELSVDQISLARKLEQFEDRHVFTINVTNSSSAPKTITGLKVLDVDTTVSMEPERMTIPQGKTLPLKIILGTPREPVRPFFLGKVVLETDHPKERQLEIRYLIKMSNVR